MISRTFTTTILADDGGSMCAIPVPFDPKEVFGKVRAPVRVTIGGHTFRSTIARMGGEIFVPLRRSNREAAGVAGGKTVTVTLELDTAPRTVEPPADLQAALRENGVAWERWQELSYTHQREHVEAIEGAKRPETRARRLAAAVGAIAARPPRKP